MRITFDNTFINTNVNTETGSNSKVERTVSTSSASFSLGSSNDDLKSYDGKKKSVDELKDEMSNKDVKVSQDYMAVMSGCMSSEDFGELVKNGGNPSSYEVKDAVTIMDRIKLSVAESGKEVKGFTDTLDKETVKELTGVESMPEMAAGFDITLDEETCLEIKDAFNELNEVNEVTDSIKKSLIINNEIPTIDNLYLAKHTAKEMPSKQGSEYFTIEARGYLAKRGDEVEIEDLKGEVKNLLVKLSIEPSEENIEAGAWLVENNIPVTIDNIDKYVSLSKIELPLTDSKFAKVVAIALSEGKEPKEADITREKSIYEEAVALTEELKKYADTPVIKATRILEETRLKMTTEANLMLLKSNVKIDTKDLEKYVEALKEIEKTPEFKERIAVSEVMETVNEVASFPAAVIAPIAPKINEISFEDVLLTYKPVKEEYEKAAKAYEQVGTEVRKDLGDSIKKAFRNVPEILHELDMEDTHENERAVRILGYNNMSITRDAIEEVKAADKKVQSIIERITPKDTLTLIRSGKSPIKMSIDELNEYLDSKEDIQNENMEKYSKFLYKLERDGDISPEERKDYIEVYRFFHQIEKTDAAAIGSVLNMGLEPSFENLKTAMRTTKHRGMELTVGEVYETIVSTVEGDALETQWRAEKFNQMKEALRAPEETVNELVLNNVEVSAENLEGALRLRKRRGEAMNEASKANKEMAKESLLGVIDEFDSKEEAMNAYAEMIETGKEAVYEEAMNAEAFMDVRAMQLVHMQLSVAGKFAANENYEVPMDFGGKVSSVNVKLVHNSSEEPNVVILFETQELGRVSARLTKENEEINGYISCNLKETVTKMQKVADTLSSKVSVVFSENSDTDILLSKIPMRENENVSDLDLYDIAKRFLSSMKGNLNEN